MIETHGGAECAIIVTDQDGNNMVFDTFSEAESEANDYVEQEEHPIFFAARTTIEHCVLLEYYQIPFHSI